MKKVNEISTKMIKEYNEKHGAAYIASDLDISFKKAYDVMNYATGLIMARMIAEMLETCDEDGWMKKKLKDHNLYDDLMNVKAAMKNVDWAKPITNEVWMKVIREARSWDLDNESDLFYGCDDEIAGLMYELKDSNERLCFAKERFIDLLKTIANVIYDCSGKANSTEQGVAWARYAVAKEESEDLV